ncbi:MAG: MBL fold metallo-hydrolase [Erysipelotrichaceae bacterium]|jgi:glyoxylase-like metal-dependent hydrolase (beta-lactamase superfamily II)|nr:MBL fold metallo-hydrolase [Erysipelotrichaceae bacterium]
MEIKTLTLEGIHTNCYLLTSNQQALLIDPGSQPGRLLRHLGNLQLVGILLTHGHYDHTGAVDALVSQYHCPVFLHQNDFPWVGKAQPEAGKGMIRVVPLESEITPLQTGEWQLGNFSGKVFLTPGHSEGSVMIRMGEHLFTGDTLFHDTVGRTDLYGGSDAQMADSCRFILTLKSQLHFYPGHGPKGILKQEFLTNPFLLDPQNVFLIQD